VSWRVQKRKKIQIQNMVVWRGNLTRLGLSSFDTRLVLFRSSQLISNMLHQPLASPSLFDFVGHVFAMSHSMVATLAFYGRLAIVLACMALTSYWKVVVLVVNHHPAVEVASIATLYCRTLSLVQEFRSVIATLYCVSPFCWHCLCK